MALDKKTDGGTGLFQPFTAPSISIPKGGGAIRGIGEKFTAIPASGTGSMVVPLSFSPGRSGFGPQLSLSYHSASGNGPFGIGWNLNLPNITRKTEKGLPRYEDSEESDVYLLSDAEDLVPVPWVDPDIFEGIEEAEVYKIDRYQPRIEGLYARIERWMHKESGIIHWRTISRDNLTTLYGLSEESRIYDPSYPARIYTWLICESYDDKGNAMIFEYAKENDAKIDKKLLNERNRIRTANRYLKRIKYGNRVSRLSHSDLSTAEWLFEAVFDYEEDHYVPLDPEPSRPDAEKHKYVRASHEAGAAWDVRPDPFSMYRSGFEVRTYRRCRRLMMFHRFQQLGSQPCLVRSTEFDYSGANYSLLRSVTQSGYVRQPLLDEEEELRLVYLKKSLPSLEFEYSQVAIQEEVQELDAESIANVPAGFDDGDIQWVDLDGEGLSGILTKQIGGWYYKPNLGGGQFGAQQLVATLPSLAGQGPESRQLMDVDGDGNLELTSFTGPIPGFFSRTDDGAWGPFRAFRQLPHIPWNDPNLRFIDVNGDGHADVLMTEHDAFTWYPSLANEGFGPAERGELFPANEEDGPRMVFADGTQSIYIADMNGDGLTDLVRIRNGEVCYWPNLGYGRFGKKIAMDNSPQFEHSDQFNQQRIRLADLDGSGTTDIIYLGSGVVSLHFNQSGNCWREPYLLSHFPQTDNLTSVMTADLFGNGTACIVWSSALPGAGRRPIRFVDLMGGQKPHLLTGAVNNLGAETRIHYAPASKFYLMDKLAGNPWITKLPFPVHVVERVETYDHISGNRFVNRYEYHHGYYDGNEREFRGFARVDQWDTEEFSVLNDNRSFPVETNLDRSTHVPPVLTRTWYHTGAYLDKQRVSDYLASTEYYKQEKWLGEDAVSGAGWTMEEEREACRALKGSILRQEIYALEEPGKLTQPYTVTENNYAVTRLQPKNDKRHAVFQSHPKEALVFHYERNCINPRIVHSISLEVDQYGNLLKSASIAYGRRIKDKKLQAADRKLQEEIKVTYSENGYTVPIERMYDYRMPLPYESCSYELTLTHDLQEIGSTRLFTFAEVENACQDAEAADYETIPADNALRKRVIEHVRTLYRKDNLEGPLPPMSMGALALPYESYKLAFTPGLVLEAYGDKVNDEMLRDEAGYVQFEENGNWWIPSGKVFFTPDTEDLVAEELVVAKEHFFLPRRYEDPFQSKTLIQYESCDLFASAVCDALGNRNKVEEHDYRVLLPKLVSDPNGNRTAVAFDALGMVAGMAVMGKPNEETRQGDLLDEEFVCDLTEQEVMSYMLEPLDDPHALIRTATSRLVYDMSAYYRTKDNPVPQPAAVSTILRETHDAELMTGQLTITQHSFSYSDGFGRVIQNKALTEAEQSEMDLPSGPRWVGSGWTIFNNKGLPVRQYEPYLTDTNLFEFNVIKGVSQVQFYDPFGRRVGTLYSNHTWEKIMFDPWRQEIWDASDTVLASDLADDPEVGNFFGRLRMQDYSPSWYEQRIEGEQGKHEQEAACKAAIHANTPSIVHFDSLGRPFLTIVHNKQKRSDSPAEEAPMEEFYETRVIYDIEGNQREVIDALQRTVVRYTYDIVGTIIRQTTLDAGERWILNDVTGKPIRTWNSRGHSTRTVYDVLGRQVETYVREGSGLEKMTGSYVYGEQLGGAEAKNVRGRIVHTCDQAGIATNSEYDFKGNLLECKRQLAENYKSTLDWTGDVALEDKVYSSRTRYDALNRPIEIEQPDRSVIVPKYNESNLLKSLDVNLRGEVSKQSGQPCWTTFVSSIEYDAKGQRTSIEYGNGVKTTYEYDQHTLRLVHLMTQRSSSRYPADNRQPPPDEWPGSCIQNVKYTYDVSGNITHIEDFAQQTIFFRNKRVEPSSDYTYDAINRLIEAVGREHLGQFDGIANSPSEPGEWNGFHSRLRQPGDGQAMGTYVERYDYDAAGNLLELQHRGCDPSAPSWKRSFQYAAGSNKLLRTGDPPDPRHQAYQYDLHGNMIQMPHLQLMEWDYREQLRATAQQTVTDGKKPEITWCVYDSSGQRIRKVTESQADDEQTPVRMKERIYWAGIEIYREYENNGASIKLERETLHVMDENQSIAIVETRTCGADLAPKQLIRYQLSNYLGSACLELGDRAQIISYEEYFPYGSTSYQSVRCQTEVPKRYRYSGKERDEESGLYYYGARYYAPWIARWTSCDPAEHHIVNLYQAFLCSPIRYADPDGRAEADQTGGDVRFSPAGSGWRRYSGLAVDEPHAVGESGITDAERMRRARDIKGNRQFLDRMFNSATKRDFAERPIVPREPLPLVSVVDQPSAVWRPSLENVKEWRELSKILDERLAERLNKVSSPGKVKEIINDAIRKELKNPTTEPGRKLHDAFLKETGMHPNSLFIPESHIRRLWSTARGRRAMANAAVLLAGAIVSYAETATAETAQKNANERLLQGAQAMADFATMNPDMGILIIQVFEVRKMNAETAAITTFRYQALSFGRSGHEALWKYQDSPKLSSSIDVFSREDYKYIWIPPLNERDMIPVTQQH